MQRTDIVGLTLAELALVLLFCMVTVVKPVHSTRNQDAVASARKDLAEQKSLVLALTKENDALRARFSAERPNLRSKQIPSCREKGIVTDWLFVTTIRERNLYDIQGGVTVTLEKLLGLYSPRLTKAAQQGCVESIEVYLGKDVSAVDYDYALRRLEEHFYTAQMGTEH